MKSVMCLLTIVICLSCIISCEKDKSFENAGIPGVGPTTPGSQGGTAVFTYEGATGSCSPINISGSFIKGQSLSIYNLVEVTVNVTKIGTYNITTSAINGASFYGSGNFIITGIQTILLKGRGTPLSTGTFTHTVGVNGCQFSIEYGLPPADYTLGGSPNACTGFSVGGVYTAGSFVADSNTVTFQANVVSPGLYTISTPYVNGISFAGSDTFTSTGLHTVTLNAVGIPDSTATSNFTVSGFGSSCTFSVAVQ